MRLNISLAQPRRKLLCVPPTDRDVRAHTTSIRRRAAKERERAAYCHARAARHETQAATGAESLRLMYQRLAALYRGARSRHLMAAEMHESLAVRMEVGRDGRADGTRSELMTAVADVLHSASALATVGRPARAAIVAASDATAQACYDLEVVMAEGPAAFAARGVVVAAAGPELLERWPRYGPAAAELGIRAVSAAPLDLAGVKLGALCVLGRMGEVPDAAAIGLMAEAVTRILVANTDIAGPGQDLGSVRLLGEAGTQAVVHQAIGMISVQCGCDIDDAADLLAARAFADGRSLVEIAHQVVRGQQLFPVG